MQKLLNFFAPKRMPALVKYLEEGYTPGEYNKVDGTFCIKNTENDIIHKNLRIDRENPLGGVTIQKILDQRAEPSKQMLEWVKFIKNISALPVNLKNPLAGVTIRTILDKCDKNIPSLSVLNYLLMTECITWIKEVVEKDKKFAEYCKDYFLGQNQESTIENLVRWYEINGLDEDVLSAFKPDEELLFDQDMIKKARQKTAASFIVKHISEICFLLEKYGDPDAWSNLIEDQTQSHYKAMHPERIEGYWSDDKLLMKTILEKTNKLFTITEGTSNVAAKDKKALKELKTFILEQIDEKIYYPIPQPQWKGAEAMIDCLELVDKFASYMKKISTKLFFDLLGEDFKKEARGTLLAVPYEYNQQKGSASKRLPVFPSDKLKEWHKNSHSLLGSCETAVLQFTRTKSKQSKKSYVETTKFGWTEGLKVYIRQWGVMPSAEFLNKFQSHIKDLQLKMKPTDDLIDWLCKNYDLENPLRDNKMFRPFPP